MNPSYRIVFYVSGHGFGHTSRTIEVIHAVLRAKPDAHIVVKTSAPVRLFARTLAGRCEFVELQCDPGMVQIDSLNIDTGASVRRAVDFHARLPSLIAAEATYLRDSGARLIVADIPPLGIAAADAAGIPSVAVANFTWDWIYDGYVDDGAREIAGQMRRLYATAGLALRLPMAGGFGGLEAVTRDIPFVARQSARTRDEVRIALGLPPRVEGKPLVLTSFGGYGVSRLNTQALAALKDFTIATTDSPSNTNVISPTAGLLYLSEQQIYANGLRYEDLVRGADVVVTKPGYGIISEAIANDTALLYTSRGHFVEYEVLVKAMPRYLRSQYIEQTQLLNGDWSAALTELLSKPAPPERPQLNGAEVAAGEILKQITKNE